MSLVKPTAPSTGSGKGIAIACACCSSRRSDSGRKAASREIRLVERDELPFTWVLSDESYGADTKFLDGVEALCGIDPLPWTVPQRVLGEGNVPSSPKTPHADQRP